jgi:DNA-binding response OmpR family regulator
MKKIMLMHKDLDLKASIKTLLEKNGYEVIEISSSEDFFKKIKTEKVDLILIDGLMPREKILNEIKGRKIKVAYFSSEDSDETELYKNVLGPIGESFDIDKFLKKIKILLKG